MISISGRCSLFLFLLNVVVFSLDGEMLLVVSKVVVFFFAVFFFNIIVEHFAGIGGLNGWFVVGNHARSIGTLTP